MPGSVQFFGDEDGPITVTELTDGQPAVMADIPAGATRVVVTAQRPPDPPKLPEPDPTEDFDLLVTVRVYRGGTAMAAAGALCAGRGTFDLPGEAEVEILTARPVTTAEEDQV